ncbi:MAG: hypothetical protein ACLQOO_33225 [Terriglobia bacterium]
MPIPLMLAARSVDTDSGREAATVNRRRTNLNSPIHRAEPQVKMGTDGAEVTPAPETLHHVDEDALSAMQPGDILMLDRVPSLREQVESNFLAVLACPHCGQLSLITPPQYFGNIPVLCGSSACSCRLRIEDRSRFVYLLLN